MGEPVLARRLHSVLTASWDLGIDPLLDATSSLVSGEVIRSNLGISRSQFDLLQADGFSPRRAAAMA